MAGPILRPPALAAYIGLSHSAIYERMDETSPRHDATFPKCFPLGGSAVGWYKDEVDEWLANCAKKRQTAASPDEQDQGSNPRPIPTPVSAKRKLVAPRRASTPAVPTAAPDATLPSQAINLGELIQGIHQNAYLTACLRLSTWTPAMGALLVSGIKAPPDCSEIPLEGEGVDGQSLHASNLRFHQARRILRSWNDQDEDPPLKINPVEFFVWCDDEAIDTDWLRLLKELAGCPNPDSVRVLTTSAARQVSEATKSSSGRSASSKLKSKSD